MTATITTASDMTQRGGENICGQARLFLDEAVSAEGTNRALARQDISFSHGNQWPVEIQNSRTVEGRPYLTINKTDAFVRQVCNQQRQQRPRIKVDPVSGGARKKMADIIGGMIRHIESKSNADMAYDTAFESAVRGGWGYFRVVADYASDDSFDQELQIHPIINPFTVYDDKNAVQPTASDRRKLLITSMMTKAAFKLEYPGKNDGSSWIGGAAGDMGDWITKDEIRVAEYYVIKETKEDLLKLSNGQSIWGEDALSPEMEKLSGVYIVKSRKSIRRRVHWYKITAMEELEHVVLPGKYIPVVRVIGNRMVIDGVQHIFGLVRTAIDPQRMYNYWRSAQTESVALAPKAKWLIADGQDEGFEDEWRQANSSARATLHYRTVDNGEKPAPPPQRLQPEPPPLGIMEAAASVDNDLTSVLGVVDPAQRISGNVSGKSLNGQAQQSENSVFNFYDNLTGALRFLGVLLLDLIPYYYDTQRVVRIIGDDGRPSQITINEQAINEILNDVTIGDYAVVMDTGPGYNTKRQEGVDAMAPMFASDPELRAQCGDIFFRMQDWPGAEQIADRLAANNPLAQIDENSDIPAGVQTKMLALQQQLKQAGMQVDALMKEKQSRIDVAVVKEQGATIRQKMKVDQEAMSDVLWSQEERQQFLAVAAQDERESLRSNFTKMSVAELQMTADVLIEHIRARNAAKTADAERAANKELAQANAGE